MQNFFAGLDVGGTSGRLILADCGGRALGTFTGPGCTLNVNGYEASRHCYRSLVLDALARLSLEPSRCLGICIAASGIDSLRQQEQCERIFQEMGFPKEAILAVNDCEVFLVGRNVPTAILIAGTGSISMARGSDGRLIRKGGWGQLLSDEGSAFNIGLRVLRAAGNHLDGRVSCPLLWHMLSERHPFEDAVAVNAFAMEHICNKPPVAELARLADQAAAAGDRTALEILQNAADALYTILRDALRQLPDEDISRAEVFLWGSVLLHSTPVSARVQQRLEEEFSLSAEFSHSSAVDEALRAARCHALNQKSFSR